MSLGLFKIGISIAGFIGFWILLLVLKRESRARGKAEANNEILQKTADTQKKQLEIAASPVLEPDAILDRMRHNGL